MSEQPDKIDKYKVEGELGRGGMGIVWLAWDEALGRKVAIKELNPQFHDPAKIEILRKEGATAVKLTGGHTVQIFGFRPDPNSGKAYMVMEYMPNGSLADLLDQNPIIPPPKCIELLRPVAETLDIAHKAGIFHRDIKPSNILFDDRNLPNISDFSIAYSLDDAEETADLYTANDPDQTIVRSVDGHIIIGTPAYMAPELLEGFNPSSSSDIFSLAVVAFEMLTGSLPYPNKFDQLKTDKAPDITEVNDQLHKDFKKIFAKALNRLPHKRYKKACDFMDALNRAASYVPVQPKDNDFDLGEILRLLGLREIEGYEKLPESYELVRKKGRHGIGVWLGSSVVCLSIWRLGNFDHIPPSYLELPIYQVFLHGFPNVFSVRLLAGWPYITFLMILLLAYVLVRTIEWSMWHVSDEIYWNGERKSDLQYLTGRCADIEKLDILIDRIRVDPATLTEGNQIEKASELFEQQESSKQLTALEAELENVLEDSDLPLGTRPARRFADRLVMATRFILALSLILVLLLLPAINSKPQGSTSQLMAVGLFAVLLLTITSLFMIFKR